MSTESTTNVVTSLWECLHDGTLESLAHDTEARTLTLVADVPYIWSFHSMPENTRFQIVLHENLTLQVLEFEPWPGRRTTIPRELPWDEQQAIRYADYAKGSRRSADWPAFVTNISKSEYEFSNAFIDTNSSGETRLFCEIGNSETNSYPTLNLLCSRITFALNSGKELAHDEFLSLGADYWNAFAARSANPHAAT